MIVNILFSVLSRRASNIERLSGDGSAPRYLHQQQMQCSAVGQLLRSVKVGE